MSNSQTTDDAAREVVSRDAKSRERTFLVVDDEPDILDAVERMFRRDYRVLSAQSVAEARDIVESESVQVVMADQRMPEMTGIEFLSELRAEHPHIVRVLFTGYSDIDNVIDAINEGHVYRYISKPWKPAELKLFVEQAFEYYESERERDRLLDELRQANERLEERNELLRNANEELKELDRIKDVFMEVVSHELNTPTAITLGYAHLLRKELGDDLDDTAAKALSGIDSSAERLKDISNRIFKMLSDEGPASTLQLASIDLGEFVDSLRTQVTPFLEKRDQSLDVQLETPEPDLRADREKLSDIFVNLLMNAIKFSPDGHNIRFEIASAARDSDQLRFVVEDRGIGIADEDRDRIFEAFFSTFDSQHHSSGDYEFGKRGIGLGLSVAQKFARMHGGRIDVESEEGEGSRFIVTLPLDPAELDETDRDLPASDTSLEALGT